MLIQKNTLKMIKHLIFLKAYNFQRHNINIANKIIKKASISIVILNCIRIIVRTILWISYNNSKFRIKIVNKIIKQQIIYN